jgi:glycosyltransferase involved in cell wall biosynthesis
MHITIVKPGRIPVPPDLYGGTQRVIYWLGKALIEQGHQVTLIANPQSHIPGAELRPIAADENDARAWHPLVPDQTDILHLWDVQNPIALKPFLVTVEGGKPGRKFHPNTVFVSRRHAACHGSTYYVHNGLDPDEYAFSAQRDDYAVFLAKARWDVKNFPGAARVARRAGVELRVLGSRNWPLNLQRLLPAIRGVRYYGMIGGDEKRDLLARARCLIFPVRWEEPFGVAITEAMVSGCYVTATPYGSLTDIVTPETGVLSVKASDHVEAVRHPERFKPQACRDRVLNGGFTHRDMARRYLSLYETILARGTLVDGPGPATIPEYTDQLLPWEE